MNVIEPKCQSLNLLKSYAVCQFHCSGCKASYIEKLSKCYAKTEEHVISDKLSKFYEKTEEHMISDKKIPFPNT